MISTKKIFLLLRREWKEHSRTFLIGLATLMAVFVLLFTLAWHFRNSFGGDTDRGIFLTGLFAGGSLFAASFMRDLRSPAKAVWQVCLPASIAEKLIVSLIFCIAGYLLAYLAAFYLIQYLFNAVVTAKAAAVTLLDLRKNKFYSFIYFFISLQLLMLIGSTVFRKAALLKTVLVLIVTFFISSMGNEALLAALTGEKHINGSTLFDYFQFSNGDENVYVYLPETADHLSSLFFRFMLPAILCCIMYFKLKETEFK